MIHVIYCSCEILLLNSFTLMCSYIFLLFFRWLSGFDCSSMTLVKDRAEKFMQVQGAILELYCVGNRVSNLNYTLPKIKINPWINWFWSRSKKAIIFTRNNKTINLGCHFLVKVNRCHFAFWFFVYLSPTNIGKETLLALDMDRDSTEKYMDRELGDNIYC